MRVSLSTACLYVYPLRQVFALAKRAGFDGVELVLGPEIELRGAAFARKLAEEYDLPILSVHPPLFGYPGWSKVNRTIAPYLRKAMKLTEEAGGPMLVIHMPMANDAESGIGREFIQTVVETRRDLNGKGPQLSLENRPRFRERDANYILTTIEDLRAFADAHDLAMTLDTAHVGTWGLDLLSTLDCFQGRLVNVHLSDLRDVSAGIEKRPILHSYVKQHQFPGEGKLPLRDFLALLRREGYQGSITFELSPTSLQAWNPKAVERKLKQAVAFVHESTEHSHLLTYASRSDTIVITEERPR